MVEIIPKQKPIYPASLNLVFGVGVLLFVAVIALVATLYILQEREKSTVEELQAKIEGVEPQVKKMEIELLQKADRVNAFAALVNSRQDVARALEFLENNTHPSVRFSTLRVSTQEQSMSMQAEATGFRVIAEQAAILRQNKEIQKFEISGVNLGEEGATFQLKVVFPPNFFQYR